jgi:hypothetical protein
MDINPRLPVRPRPIQDEATLGYLARVAEANGYESPRQLKVAIKTVYRLKTALGVSEHDIQLTIGAFPGY